MFGIFKGLKEAWTIETTKMRAEKNLPILSQAIHFYELGTYGRLAKDYEKRYQGDFCYSLAYTVVYHLFLNEEGMKSMESFYKANKRLVDEEIHRSLRDEGIKNAFSMACGAKIMVYTILKGDPRHSLLEEGYKISTHATDLDVEIVNFVRLWGPKAMVNLHQHAKDYMNSLGGGESHGHFQPPPKSENAKIIIDCPKCFQKLRIPSGRHLRVSCPSCAHVFEV